MDGLRFVLEAPQLSQTHKKRPRLVTSCDNWSVARSSASAVEPLTHPPRTQSPEEDQVCPGQVPGSLRGLRGRQHPLPVP